MLGESNTRRASGATNPTLAAAIPRIDSSRPLPAAARISCIVCAYNEADRIRNILEAVRLHPALSEVIVVNDGSTDDTETLLAGYPGIKVISYTPNQGKTFALSQGIAAASGEFLMLLDADLSGVTAADVQALADPVISGRAQVSISLRSNSLALYRALGLDFVSGERVIPARLMAEAVKAMERLPRWGGEVFINSLIIANRLSIAVVDWPRVYNIRKYKKVGRWRGVFAELSMVGDAFRVLSPWGVVSQNLKLLKLVRRAGGHARVRRSFRDIVNQVLP
jgi:glycosyltransferase involved in cell wall biosynthesis